jgi:hypothetical protein
MRYATLFCFKLLKKVNFDKKTKTFYMKLLSGAAKQTLKAKFLKEWEE